MARMNQPASGAKRVWRITDDAPMGAYVDRTAPKANPHPLAQPEVVYGGWVESSFDLLHGTDVSDNPDTLTPELLDELFGDGATASD